MASKSRMSAEITKLRAQNAELQRENNELKRQLFNLGPELVELRALAHPRAPKPHPLLDDKEYIELARIKAWSENSKFTEYWDDEAKDFVYPDGWPEGIDGDSYVAASLDYEPPEPKEPAPGTDSILRGLLHGK